jgi:hypothetical protein
MFRLNTVTALAVVAGVWAWRYIQTQRREKNWPKLIPISMLEVMKGLQGLEQPLYLLDLVRKYGSVFRVRFPFIYPLIVVSDIKVYRAIAVSSSDAGTRSRSKKAFEAISLTGMI